MPEPTFCPLCGLEKLDELGRWLATNRDTLDDDDFLELFCRDCGFHFLVVEKPY